MKDPNSLEIVKKFVELVANEINHIIQSPNSKYSFHLDNRYGERSIKNLKPLETMIINAYYKLAPDIVSMAKIWIAIGEIYVQPKQAHNGLKDKTLSLEQILSRNHLSLSIVDEAIHDNLEYISNVQLEDFDQKEIASGKVLLDRVVEVDIDEEIAQQIEILENCDDYIVYRAKSILIYDYRPKSHEKITSDKCRMKVIKNEQSPPVIILQPASTEQKDIARFKIFSIRDASRFGDSLPVSVEIWEDKSLWKYVWHSSSGFMILAVVSKKNNTILGISENQDHSYIVGGDEQHNYLVDLYCQ
ncbi:MAG: hypothetical protein M1338_02120 [Patescibacteria group bacterium]|nr:hypothetical protein [Patescibacteria group bacterium]